MASRTMTMSWPRPSSSLTSGTRNFRPLSKASPSRSRPTSARSALSERHGKPMGIFDRFSTVLRSNIDDLIARAEDPEKMLNQILVDMRSQLVKAKQQVAAAIADEKRLRDQADAEYKLSADWESRAMLAIKEGRDDLAKQALVRQAEHATHGQQLEQTWETHRVETEKLKNSLRDLNDKIEEAKRKKNLLIARQRRAQAQQRIHETMSSMSEKSAFEAFARMEERIEIGRASWR